MLGWYGFRSGVYSGMKEPLMYLYEIVDRLIDTLTMLGTFVGVVLCVGIMLYLLSMLCHQ